MSLGSPSRLRFWLGEPSDNVPSDVVPSDNVEQSKVKK
jgi:hypothetical protein